MGRKHSAIEHEERIIFILKCRSDGIKATSELWRLFSEKYPDLSKRQFEYDLKIARERIAEYMEKDARFEAAEIVKHYWELFNKNRHLQDFRECRNILNDIVRLKGHEVQKMDVTSNGETVNAPFMLIKTESELKDKTEK